MPFILSRPEAAPVKKAVIPDMHRAEAAIINQKVDAFFARYPKIVRTKTAENSIYGIIRADLARTPVSSNH